MTRRDRAYKWRLRNGRQALVGAHYDEVAWPQKLIELGRLPRGQEADKEAILQATIRYIDDILIGEDG